MQPTPTTEATTGQQLTVPQFLDLARQASIPYTTIEDGCRWVLQTIAESDQPVGELLGTGLTNNQAWTQETGGHPLDFPLLNGMPLARATADDLFAETVTRAVLSELQQRAGALAATLAGRDDTTPGGRRSKR